MATKKEIQALSMARDRAAAALLAETLRMAPFIGKVVPERYDAPDYVLGLNRAHWRLEALVRKPEPASGGSSGGLINRLAVGGSLIGGSPVGYCHRSWN